jgi:hypothetical protein
MRLLEVGRQPIRSGLKRWQPKMRHTRPGSLELDSSPENRRQEESNNRSASGGKEIDDLLNGLVCAVVGAFKFARRLVAVAGRRWKRLLARGRGAVCGRRGRAALRGLLSA